MHLRLAMPLLAAFAISAPALAEDTAHHQMMPMNQEDMAKHHDRMCTDHYAHAVGALAALDVELKLTPAQKPLFERWKNVKLASAKTMSAKCAEMKMPPAFDGSILEARKHQIAMLELRLADLKAETPSLEALVNALDKDQQEALKHAAMHAMHDHMEGMMQRGARGEMRHHDHGDMPPPPPEH